MDGDFIGAFTETTFLEEMEKELVVTETNESMANAKLLSENFIFVSSCVILCEIGMKLDLLYTFLQMKMNHQEALSSSCLDRLSFSNNENAESSTYHKQFDGYGNLKISVSI